MSECTEIVKEIALLSAFVKAKNINNSTPAQLTKAFGHIETKNELILVVNNNSYTLQ
jgi:hypothetical protein